MLSLVRLLIFLQMTYFINGSYRKGDEIDESRAKIRLMS